MPPSSGLRRNLIASIIGGDHSSLEVTSTPLPPRADPRIVLPTVPQEIPQVDFNLRLRQYIDNALSISTSLPPSSLLLQVLVTEVWRNEGIHGELLQVIIAALPFGVTLCELVLSALVFPTLEALVSACQIHSDIRTVHLVGVRWLGPGVLPHPARKHVPHIAFQMTELRISNSLNSDSGISLLDGLKDTLTKLVLDVPAAANIAGSGSRGELTLAKSSSATGTDTVHNSPLLESHAPEVPPRRDNTIVMVQLTSFVIELGMMKHPLVADGQTEREAEVVRPFRLAQCPFIVEPPAITDCQISKVVDSDLAKARPLFDRVVMPNADVLLRLRLEPTDVASEADLNHDASEFVQGRGAFSVVENLGPSVRGFSNFLQERHLGVSQASGAPNVKVEA